MSAAQAVVYRTIDSLSQKYSGGHSKFYEIKSRGFFQRKFITPLVPYRAADAITAQAFVVTPSA